MLLIIKESSIKYVRKILRQTNISYVCVSSG